MRVQPRKGKKIAVNQVGEEKVMRIAAQGHAFDMAGMLEAGHQSRRYKAEAEAKETVETRIVSVKTEAI